VNAVAVIRRAALAAMLALAPAVAAAQLPPVDAVAFAPARGAVLPLDARFTDESGRRLQLADLVRDRPAIIVPAYYGCSNLCTIVLRATQASLAAAGLHAGRDVNVVAISFAPLETPALALAKKRDLFGAASGGESHGWHLLTGDEAAIGRVTTALGYRYTYVADDHQYAHAAGIAVVAPDGRIARVLYGVAFPVADLRRAVAAARSPSVDVAAQDVQQPDPDRTGAANWLLCFHYDPKTGRYSLVAMNAVRAAGLLALIALAGYAVASWRRERHGRRADARAKR
jgi:protein SCO1/2